MTNEGTTVLGHFSDEELMQHLYGAHPNPAHAEVCSECQVRLTAMRSARHKNETLYDPQDSVSFDLLAAQRRRVYSKLGQRSTFGIRRWASAVALLGVVGGGFFAFEQQQRISADSKITDAQLASEVAQMSQNPEPDSTAPLQELFE